MTHAQHTPGPWETASGTYDPSTVIFGDVNNPTHDGDNPPVLKMWHDKKMSEEDKANIRLACAAPELLEALQKIIDSAYVYPETNDVSIFYSAFENARAAIAKARGQS